MPLYKDFSDAQSDVLVWKYEEGESFDVQELLEPENYQRFKVCRQTKKLEMLMIRRILQQKLPGRKILYAAEGEPYLEPRDFEISISHSFPYAVLAVSKEKIGVDIEPIREKITRLKDKFILAEEQRFIPEPQMVEYLTVIWSLKESLYKIHHSNFWSLKQHYEVRPFHLGDETVACRVYDDQFSDYFLGHVRFFDGMVLTLVH